MSGFNRMCMVAFFATMVALLCTSSTFTQTPTANSKQGVSVTTPDPPSEQSAQPKTYRGDVRIRIPERRSNRLFLDKNPYASEEDIVAEICRLLRPYGEDLDTRRGYFEEIFKLPIYVGNRRVTKLANGSLENRTLLDSLYDIENDRHRFLYIDCLPHMMTSLQGEKEPSEKEQKFCNWFITTQINDSMTVEQRVEEFYKSAAKAKVVYSDHQRQEANMFILLDQTARDLATLGKYPGDDGVKAYIRTMAQRYDLVYLPTEDEFDDIFEQFKNTIVMNCVYDVAQKSKWSAAVEKVSLESKDFVSEVQKLLIVAGFVNEEGECTFTTDEIQKGGRQYEQTRNMCSLVGKILMALETANQAGDKPTFLAIGEFHRVEYQLNLETYLMHVVIRHWCKKDPNRRIMFVVERDKALKDNATLIVKDMCEYLLDGNLALSCTLYNAFGIDPIPVDELWETMNPDEAKSDKGLLKRSVKMTEVICALIQDLRKITNRPQDILVIGLFGDIHTAHFQGEKKLHDQLEKAYVPIYVELCYNGDYTYCFNDNKNFGNIECPEVFNERRTWQLVRRLFPERAEEVAVKLNPLLKGMPIEQIIRISNCVDPFAHEAGLFGRKQADREIDTYGFAEGVAPIIADWHKHCAATGLVNRVQNWLNAENAKRPPAITDPGVGQVAEEFKPSDRR